MKGNMFKRLERFMALAVTASLLGLTVCSELFAQEAATPEPPGFGQILRKMMPMFAFVFLIFYFMVMKPQQDKLRNQKSLIEGLKRGDQVVTSSGIIARVATIDKDFILLEVSNNVKIKFEPAHILKRLDVTEKAPN